MWISFGLASENGVKNGRDLLLFLDESGHDHRQMPYEVRGGVALHVSRIWPFEQQWVRLEEDCFGSPLHLYRKEIKGCKLVDKDRLRWSQEGDMMEAQERRKLCRSFLTKGLEKAQPTFHEFVAYGQACKEMALGILQLLMQHEAVLFASMIPKGCKPPKNFHLTEYLRKDHVFLLERFYYLLEQKGAHGILVMDEVEKETDRRFVRQLQAYFKRTNQGRLRSSKVVPTPFFVSSEMTHPVQAADLCIYLINLGFRIPALGLDAPANQTLAVEFGSWLHRMQFSSEIEKEGQKFNSFGIVYVPDPYSARTNG